MPPDQLGKRLHEAEAELGCAPAGPADLVPRVYAVRARRRQRRRALGAGCVGLAMVLGVGWGLLHWNRSKPVPGVTPPVVASLNLARLRFEMDLLDLEANARTDGARRLAAALRQQDRITALRAQAAPDPRVQIRQEIDGAAFTLLNQGDRLYRELALREPAAAAYREVIRLFPESCWATVAKQRLAQLEQRPGETS